MQKLLTFLVSASVGQTFVTWPHTAAREADLPVTVVDIKPGAELEFNKYLMNEWIAVFCVLGYMAISTSVWYHIHLLSLNFIFYSFLCFLFSVEHHER